MEMTTPIIGNPKRMMIPQSKLHVIFITFSKLKIIINLYLLEPTTG